MIQLESVTFRYTSPENLFENFSWGAERGETWAVLGPSGCGKSTMLYLLAGLRLPQNGQVLVNGQPVLRPRPQTGLILQDYGLLPWANVRQNASLGLELRDFYGPDGKHAPLEASSEGNVTAWLERLNLTTLAEKYPSQLSGGQRQRTAIARTLVMEPDLLLMDEPFSSLDAPARESLQDLILELTAERGLTLIIVTHSIEEAAILGQKILLLNDPPNSRPTVIKNTNATQKGYRTSQKYLEMCQCLRELLNLQFDPQFSEGEALNETS